MKKFCFFITSFTIFIASLFASQTNSKTNIQNIKFWNDTFEYGTTSQKIAILNSIKGKKQTEAAEIINKYLPLENNLKVKKEMLSTLVILNSEYATKYIENLFQTNNLSAEMIKFLISSVSLLKYKEAGKYVLKYIDSNDIEIKETAIRTLGEIEYSEALPILISKFTNEENEQIRTAIILSVANMKSEKAEDFLIEIFTNKNEKLLNRNFAATGLGYIKSEKSFNVLFNKLDEAEIELKIRIIDALEKHNNKKAFNKLFELTKEDNPEIRYYALKAISKFESEKIKEIAEYKKNYDPDSKVRKLAENILKEKNNE